jgi:hypothetical protein
VKEKPMGFNFSRRSLLQGALAAAGAAAASKVGVANAQVAEESAVVMIFLRGGYNALFSSADSFSSAGTFGCAPGNVMSLGNGLVIDAATYGTLPQIARNNMAAIGVNHGISSHDPARLADWTNGSRSYALMLANAMGGNAAIRCPVLGGTFPDGPRPQEGNVSMQAITDLSATINALGGGTADPTIPARGPGAAALIAAKNQSAAPLAANPNSLKSVREAYDSSIAALQGAAGTFDFPSVASAYGFTSTQTTVNSFRAKMMAAEVMISAGAKVAIAVENSTGWDTHGDTNGAIVRQRMNATVLPGLRTFLSRMMAAPGRNVTVCIFGDFARSLPGSDHARCVSATVIGKKVRVGTTGRVSSAVGLPQGSASVPQLWSYLAAVSKAPTNPFGANPHSALVLP